MLPTAVALAALACVEGFPVTPLCATPPGCALVGPAVTEVETPCANRAGLGAHHLGVGDLRTVALDFDVQIVLERQGDGVLQGEI